MLNPKTQAPIHLIQVAALQSVLCLGPVRENGEPTYVLIDDEGPKLAFGPISKLADTYDLSVYDAAYLELALRRGLPLASRDTALNKAAKAAGLKSLL